MKRKQILFTINIEHAVEIRSAEARAWSIDCAQRREAVEGDFVGSDADDRSVLFVKRVYGAGAGSFPVFVGETPFCCCEEFGAGDCAEGREEGIDKVFYEEGYCQDSSC